MALEQPTRVDKVPVRLGTSGRIAEREARRGGRFGAIAGAVFLGLALVAFALWFFVIRTDPSDVSVPEDLGDVVASDLADSDDVASDPGGEAGSTAGTDESTSGSALDVSAEVCPDPNSAEWAPGTLGPVVTCPNYPGGRPQQPISEPGVGHIAVLDSIPLADIGTVDARSAEIVQSIFDAENRTARVGLYDSRSYRGLADPAWVLFAGPFQTEAAVLEYCTARPHLTSCTPAELDPATQ